MRERASMIILLSALAACARKAPPAPLLDASTDASAVADAGAAEDVPDASPEASLHATNDAGAPRDASSPDASALASLPADALLTVDYSACLGSCTPYTLTLAADGTFRGGRAPKTLGIAATQSVFALADEAFDPPPRCGQLPTDVQRVTVTYRRGGKTRRVVHLGGCTRALEMLQRRMNGLR